jgi:hypothetical protein
MRRQDEGGREKTSMLSRRALVGAMTIGAGAAVAGSRDAMAQTTERGFRKVSSPAPRATLAPMQRPTPILTPTSSPSIRCSRNMSKGTRRSNACGPVRSGQRVRPGVPKAAIWCGVTRGSDPAAIRITSNGNLPS